MYRPYDVAVGPDETVWVADSGNHRLQQFRPDGSWRAVFGGPGLEPGQFEWPNGIALVGDTDIWVADSGNHRVQQLRYDGSGVRAVAQATDRSGANFSQPAGVGFGDMSEPPELFIADTGNGRVQRIDSLTGAPLAAWGVRSVGTNDNGLREPAGLVSLTDNVIVVADTHNHRLQVRDRKGKLLRIVGTKGAGLGELVRPWDLVRAPDGTVLVTDNGNNRIQRLSAGLTALANFGSLGKGDGEVNLPRGLAVAADGSIVVADTGNYRVARFTSAGKPLPGWPIPPNGTIDPEARTQPPGPSDVAVDAGGLVYVADPGFSRVARFDRAGSPMGVIGGPGAAVNRFQAPDSLAFGHSTTPEADAQLAVSDSQLNRVQVFADHYPTRWRAAYFANRHFVGAPAKVLLTDTVGVGDQDASNLADASADLLEDGWSVRFERLVKVSRGQVHFRLTANQAGARLWFGNHLVVDEADAPGVHHDATIDLPAGDIVIRVELIATSGAALPPSLAFEWTPPPSPAFKAHLPFARR